MGRTNAARHAALLAIVAALAIYAAAQAPWQGDVAVPHLERSLPYIGAPPAGGGPGGEGILVAVIDTGIDYGHPDLAGFGAGGKVAGGFNFIEPDLPPLDTTGHGTQVAGIIAANGALRGVAPEARLLAYKVSEDGEGVRPDLIVRALQMAVDDGADIVNISLGVNKTNSKIDDAIAEAVRQGVIVVAAAGNDGAHAGTIGSPGRSPAAITVGATYNNLTSSQVATLQVDGVSYVVMPMVDSTIPDGPVVSDMVNAGYSRPDDYSDIDVAGAIVLAERGSDKAGELLYFSLKEKNAADAGAAAIVVFNNEPGIFYGELVHQFVEEGYEPRIPALSMDRQDGLKIKDMLPATARLLYLHDPDHPAPFSSRGPAPPFVKPDVMAPGVYVNTTALSSGYAVSSGTSYAAPHVSGAAALLLQRHPGLAIEDVRSILATTSAGVTGDLGARADLHAAGSGRLDVARALAADLVAYPPVLSASITPQRQHDALEVSLKTISGGALKPLSLRLEPEDADISYQMQGDTLQVRVGPQQAPDTRIILEYDNMTYAIPVQVSHTEGTVHATQENGRLHFEVSYPGGWDFAKITASSRNGEEYRASLIPDKGGFLDVSDNGMYHVRADIVVGSQSHEAFYHILVDTVPEDAPRRQGAEMPWRQIAVAGAAAGVVGSVFWVRPGGRRP